MDSVTAEISGGTPAIGRGIANTDTFVLDQYLALAPAGVPGELYLAGPGMARGYDRRPAETASRFVANPFAADGSRMYRTGDLVRRTPDGSLEFLSRTDEQVKVRGFRIELGEIEAALSSHPQVDRAVAVADGDPAHRVVAYYTGDRRARGPARPGRRQAARLHGPGRLYATARHPPDARTASWTGRPFRRRPPLPAPAPVPPRRPRTNTPCAGSSPTSWAWTEVSMGDDFFVLGGHSLLAVSMMGGIREAFGTELPLRMLFDEPTPAGLLAAVHRQTGHDGSAGPAASAGPRTRTAARTTGQPEPAAEPVSLTDWLAGADSVRPDRLALSYAQSRMWFLNQLDPGSADYNISLAVRLTGALDEQALAAAVGALFRRHEVLRTIYPETGGVPEQLVLDPSDAAHGAGMRLAVSAAATRGRGSRPAAGRRRTRLRCPLRAAAAGEADPGRRPADEPEWVLHLVMHHIASDGASLAPLARDLSAAYEAARGRRSSPAAGPAPLPLQYADYANWQRQQLDGTALTAKLDHWRSALSGIPAELMLPADHRRPRESRQPGRQLTFRLDPASVTALNGLASASNASLFMALHAALAAFLHRSGAGDDLVIGSPTAGRTDPALRELVGFFVNTLPLRVGRCRRPQPADHARPVTGEHPGGLRP